MFVNSGQQSYEFDQVQVDFERGYEQMVSYLLDRKQYTGIGYIGGIYDGPGGRIGVTRAQALRRLLEKRGLYDERLFHIGEISRESGYELACKAIREHTLAEAMLLGSDEVAEGAMDAFREMGVRIPKDVAVIIYQDLQKPWRANGPPAPAWRCTPTMCGKTPWSCSSGASAASAARRSR